MDAELWAGIRRLYEVERLSKRAIGRRLGIHRKTVRAALESPGGWPQAEPRSSAKVSKLEPYKPVLTGRIKEYPELSGKKLLGEIKKLGYSGSYTILKRYLRLIRPGKAEVYLRLETLPGEFAQVDWAHVGKVPIGNSTRKVSAFVMVLSYSRMLYLEFTLSQCIEDFMQCHVNAFNYFGGVPKKINYDNLRSVVLHRVNREIKFNSKFMDFCGTYLFEPVPCGVRMAHEKGKVENGIKFVRSSLLAGFELVDYNRLKEEGRHWMDQEANTRIHGTTHERPIDRFEMEKRHLMPLPLKPYDCSITEPVQSTRQALIHFQANRYSVPSAFANRAGLTLKATAQTVFLYEGPRLITVHPRCYEKHRVIERPEHYAGLLEARKKARQSRLLESFLAISPLCPEYLKGLAQLEIHLPSHLDKILKLAGAYSRLEMTEAISHALKYNAFGASYIQNILHQQRAVKNLPKREPLVLLKKPEWAELTIEQTELSLYDELFEYRPDGQPPMNLEAPEPARGAPEDKDSSHEPK